MMHQERPVLLVERMEKTEKLGLFSSSRNIFLFCLGVLIINSLLIKTFFNPDEHGQALEVAHHIVSGYGHLMWEWKKGIRSYLHPMLFAFLYKILALLHLDNPLVMRKAPRLLHSLFSAVGDLYLYRLSDVLLGGDVAKWAIFSQLTNWFMFYCFIRTFSNSLETVLTLISLFYWPCLGDKPNHEQSASRRWGLAFAALACTIRPTSAITWLYIGFLELFLARDRAKFVFLELIPVGEQREVLDESQRFLTDPIGFTEEYARNWSTPSHIVMFDSEERLLQEFLLSNSFKKIKRFFHAHFEVDRNLQSSVVVYALREE